MIRELINFYIKYHSRTLLASNLFDFKGKRKCLGEGLDMIKKFYRYLRLLINPYNYKRNLLAVKARVFGRDKLIDSLNNEIKTLRITNTQLKKEIQKKDKQIDYLQRVSLPNFDVIDFNSKKSMEIIFSSEEIIEKYNSDLQYSVYKLFLDVLISNVNITTGSKILDAGCCFGIFTKMLRDNVGSVNIQGFDFSNEAIIRACKMDSGINYYVHDIYDCLPERYNLITCTEVLEHLTDPEAAIYNLEQALFNKGVLFFTVPDGRIDRSNNHVNFWSPESWRLFIDKLCNESFYIDTGIAQHPEIAKLRYNWAILRLR